MFHKKRDPRTDELLKEIEKTQRELEHAYLTFETVIDPDLIDSCIYEVNAIQHRYKFLLRQAKSLPHFNADLICKSQSTY